MIDDTAGLRRILLEYRRIAVVGLSANRDRPSHGVAKYLQDHGYTIVPINPAYDEVLGRKCYSSLRDVPEPVDIVDIFRKPADVLPIVDEAIAIGARCVWFQLGVINAEAARRAEAAGLEVVMDHCMKIEHDRLIGEAD
jgi:predicted CoA-binding protein